MTATTVKVGIVVVLLVVGCGGSGSGDAGNPSESLPIHSLSEEEGVPGSELRAKLAMADGCVFLEADAGNRVMPVWPTGTALNSAGVDLQGTQLEFGEDYLLFGGIVSEDSPALSETQMPESCTFDEIFLVAEAGEP